MSDNGIQLSKKASLYKNPSNSSQVWYTNYDFLAIVYHSIPTHRHIIE